MQMTNQVLALNFRKGSSKKDGANKDRPYVSFTALDYEGNIFDFFCWNNKGILPDNITTPCLMECLFDVVSKQDRVEIECLLIHSTSAAFSIGSVFKAAKIPLEPVVKAGEPKK